MRNRNAYFTVEAALVLPVVIGAILFVIYMMLFQYDRCLLEQDIGGIALWGSIVEASDTAELEQKVRQLEAAAKAEPIPAEIVPDEETIRRIREEVSAEQAKAIQEANARAEQAAAALQKAQNVEAIRTNMIFSNLQDIAGRLAESLRALDVQQPETAERFRTAIADFYESRADALREAFEGGLSS